MSVVNHEAEKRVTDLTLRAWLRAGPVDKGIGGGLTFMASASAARKCQASWILRYRFAGKSKEKALGRYPDISLQAARELARIDRAKIQQGVDVAAEKQHFKLVNRRKRHALPCAGSGTRATSSRTTTNRNGSNPLSYATSIPSSGT